MCFLANYAGPLLILLSSNNLGKVQSIPVGKFPKKNFVGALTIHSAGPNQIYADICATFPLLDSNRFKASIPNSFLYCFDNTVSELHMLHS